MRKSLRWLGLGLLVLVVGIVCFGVAVRFSNEPVGPFPGGPLVAGQLVEEPVRDWTFVDAVREIDLQLLDPPRSRTTWILLHEGNAYIPCGIPNFWLWKQWPHEAVADGRGLIRVEGTRYRVQLRRVDDAALERQLRDTLGNKYMGRGEVSGPVWFFVLDPPATG